MTNEVFFSYAFENQPIVEKIYYYFARFGISSGEKLKSNIFFYDKVIHKGSWEAEVKGNIGKADYFVFFLGASIGQTQKEELEHWQTIKKKDSIAILVTIENQAIVPEDDIYTLEQNVPYIPLINNTDIIDEFGSFKRLFKILEGDEFKFHDGLPASPQIFNYEKDIINFYTNKYKLNAAIRVNPEIAFEENTQEVLEDIKEKLDKGIPSTWPKVKKNELLESRNNRITYSLIENPLKDIGQFREDDDRVLAAALTKFHKCGFLETTGEGNPIKQFCMMTNEISFPEAGPRENIYYPKDIPYGVNYTVAILVSGGIAPGTNALIDSITRRHFKYAKKSGYEDKLEVLGLKNGFKSLDTTGNIYQLLPDARTTDKKDVINTSEIIGEGGSVLGTSRDYELEKDGPERIEKLKSHLTVIHNMGINILYVIGGEGSMKAAHALNAIYEQKYPEDRVWRFNVVGIPKTMDNDILWVWQTFGFMSAVEKAREFIDYLAVETKSNPRLGIVQLFGSNSGYVVSHAVLASRTGICDFALIPESPFLLRKLIIEARKTLRQKNHGLIIASETAIPEDAIHYLDQYEDKISLTEKEDKTIRNHFKSDKVIKGHIDDELRDASFKIIKVALEESLYQEFRKSVLTNEPRHLIRAIPPSTIDIIHASRLGILAVDNAMAGYTDFMISQWLTEYCLIPLDLVVLGRKRIPKDGIFWKSVITKTGQDDKLEPEKKKKEKQREEKA